MPVTFRDVQFAPDDPVAAGHFPGNPIIPGALLVDEALRAIIGAAAAPGGCEIRAVKFLAPVRPGDRIRIQWREERRDIHFECILLETRRTAVTGTLRLSAARP